MNCPKCNRPLSFVSPKFYVCKGCGKKVYNKWYKPKDKVTCKQDTMKTPKPKTQLESQSTELSVRALSAHEIKSALAAARSFAMKKTSPPEEVSLHLEGPAIEAEVVSTQEEGKEEVKKVDTSIVKPLSFAEKEFMYQEAIKKCQKIIDKAKFDMKNYKIRLRKLQALIKKGEEL